MVNILKFGFMNGSWKLKLVFSQFWLSYLTFGLQAMAVDVSRRIKEAIVDKFCFFDWTIIFLMFSRVNPGQQHIFTIDDLGIYFLIRTKSKKQNFFSIASFIHLENIQRLWIEMAFSASSWSSGLCLFYLYFIFTYFYLQK